MHHVGAGPARRAIAQRLRRCEGLTLITNDLNIALELAGTDLEICRLAGRFAGIRHRQSAPLAEKSLRADPMLSCFFLKVEGFDLEFDVIPRVSWTRQSIGRW